MARKILVIDDSRVTVVMVKDSLIDHGYQVVVAHDGKEGLEKVKTEQPDLIILDMQMPEMTGDEFVQELKRTQGREITPVIMLTASETMEGLEGVKGYFKKPAKVSDLIKKVKECLAEP